MSKIQRHREDWLGLRFGWEKEGRKGKRMGDSADEKVESEEAKKLRIEEEMEHYIDLAIDRACDPL